MISFLYSPFPTLEAARSASEALLTAKCVACCNLIPGIESHYMWEGKPTLATEILLIAKTTPEQATLARDILARHHPYECPAILGFGAEANPAFAAWVKGSVGA